MGKINNRTREQLERLHRIGENLGNASFEDPVLTAHLNQAFSDAANAIDKIETQAALSENELIEDETLTTCPTCRSEHLQGHPNLSAGKRRDEDDAD